MVWYFIDVYIINRTLHGCLEMQNFSSRVEKIDKFHISVRPCNILYVSLTLPQKQETSLRIFDWGLLGTCLFCSTHLCFLSRNNKNTEKRSLVTKLKVRQAWTLRNAKTFSEAHSFKIIKKCCFKSSLGNVIHKINALVFAFILWTFLLTMSSCVISRHLKDKISLKT